MELQAEEVVIEAVEPAMEAVPESNQESQEERLAFIIESVLFAAGTPLTIKRLSDILGGPRRGPSNKEIAAALERLEQDYAPGRRGIQLVQVAGGYQLRTARENSEWVRAVFRERPQRLGRAAMETLAIIAYRQPATRAEIEAVRGVDADAAINTLLSRRLVRIAGRKEALGRPLLYSTTTDFLEAFGLKDLSELPSLKELGPIIDEQAIEAAAAAPEASSESTEPVESVESAAPVVEAELVAHDDSDDEDEQRSRTVAEDSRASGDSLAARGRDSH